MRRDALITLKLTQEECRSLEICMDEQARKMNVRNLEYPSVAAAQLVERYLSISSKVRAARNPAPREKVRA